MDSALYNRLADVRAALKKKYAEGGRTPTICTDEALRELARCAPRTREELAYVNGLGKTFAEKYGDAFLEVLDRYHAEQKPQKILTSDVRSTLKNLENRLVNINKKNRLLYMGKLYAKYAVDMYVREQKRNRDLQDFLLHPTRRSITVVDTGAKQGQNKRYTNLVTLLREVNRDARETGQYDLYIGYPYVEGRMKGENFNIKAPLMLFPVVAERDANSVVIRIDESKDVLYNTNLVLTHRKFSGLGGELPNPVYESTGDFAKDIRSYYADNGILYEGAIGGLEPFGEYASDKFPHFENGEYRIVNNAVLGKFSIYSSALQHDFRDIAEAGEVNPLVSDLLSDIGELDYYADESSATTAETAVVSEKDIFYINDLNASQENAIASIERLPNLVIQGPPGTGKSQTITSIIADFVAKGKSVLMVSQKKAALDVIYSRLGDLSRYAVQVHDTKDKDEFYTQIGRLLDGAARPACNERDLSMAALSIDAQIEKLERIAKELYEPCAFGVPMYELYQENLGNMFLKISLANVNVFARNVDASILGLNYRDLCAMREFTENDVLVRDAVRYFGILEKYPWVKDMIHSLGNFDVIEMQEQADGFYKEHVAFLRRSALSRLAGARKHKKALRAVLKKYFVKRPSYKLFYRDPLALIQGFACYEDFAALDAAFQVLSPTQMVYLDCVYRVSKELGWDLREICDGMFDYCVFRVIDDFECTHRPLLHDVSNFSFIVRQTAKMVSQKKALTRDRLASLLTDSFAEQVGASKRLGEMKRVVESKRRPSVTKFLDKFGFELFKGVRIWLMTPETVSEVLPLESGLFDLLVFDEASQIYIEKGIPAIARASKVIIVGDHKQLRPSSLGMGRFDGEDDTSEEPTLLDEESLLDLARFRYPEVMLNYHYRSRYEELIAFSNHAFYKGKLCISPNATPPSAPPIEVIRVEDGRWINRTNPAEAHRVVELVRNLLCERNNRRTIGIITFNSAQRDLILDLLDTECARDADFAAKYTAEQGRTDNGEDTGLFVKNIENVQGDERDCIIFSFAYARNETGKVVRNFGWLNQSGGENRLNVAISRAKEKIYVVTSITADELVVDDLTNDGPKILKRYLAYAYAVSGGNRETARQILLSLSSAEPARSRFDYDGAFEQDVYEALTGAGYIVERQVGIGGYRITLAIKDESGRYLLGIDCDGKLYHTVPSARERDLYRTQYLESRGWRMYRVWSNNWWRDSRKELRRIREAINYVELN